MPGSAEQDADTLGDFLNRGAIRPLGTLHYLNGAGKVAPDT